MEWGWAVTGAGASPIPKPIPTAAIRRVESMTSF